MRNNHPYISIAMATKSTLPASKKLNNRYWHNPTKGVSRYTICLTVEPLAYSLPMGVMDNGDGSATLDVEKLLGKDNYSEWFQEKFSGFDDFLETSLKGLEEPATNFLLAVEAELQLRAIKEKTEKTMKSSRRKGIRELRGLFSSVNYGSTSTRHIGKW